MTNLLNPAAWWCAYTTAFRAEGRFPARGSSAAPTSPPIPPVPKPLLQVLQVPKPLASCHSTGFEPRRAGALRLTRGAGDGRVRCLQVASDTLDRFEQRPRVGGNSIVGKAAGWSPNADRRRHA